MSMAAPYQNGLVYNARQNACYFPDFYYSRPVMNVLRAELPYSSQSAPPQMEDAIHKK